MMIEFTVGELHVIAGLLDAGVRAVGARALTEDAVSALKKLDTAAREISERGPLNEVATTSMVNEPIRFGEQP